IYFEDKVIGHLNVNWLSPVKVRTTLIGGQKKMLLWNDLEADEKVRIYDKGIDGTNGDGSHQLRVSYRAGGLWVPRLEHVEALTVETQYFVDCVLNNSMPFNDGKSGLRVVQMLEAVDRSMARMGELTYCPRTARKMTTVPSPTSTVGALRAAQDRL